MLIDYLPIVVLAALAAVFAVGIARRRRRCCGRNRPNPVKLSAYECGNDPVRLPRGERFSVKFYVVAMLFIIFDIETIFLFPWAVAFRAARAVRARRDGGVHRARVRRLRLHLAQGWVRLGAGDDRAERVEEVAERERAAE